jgi:hypothetical protein
MIRSLFAAALEINHSPELHLSVYTVMKVVRAKLSVANSAAKYNEIMKLLKVKKIITPKSTTDTHAMIATINNIKMDSMLELSIYVATNLANEQHGRIKLEKDGDDLVFTLTMPTVPEFPKI